MKTIHSLVVRNLKIYFRDRALVLYSLMSVFIIIGLYALFLGNVMAEEISRAVAADVNVRPVVDSWIMSGLVLVNAVNVPLMMLDTMVVDRWSGRLRDFVASPMKRSHLTASYLVASWVIGMILELVTIALAEIYIVVNGGSLLSPLRMLEAVLAAALCVVTYSAVFFFVTLFFKSPNAFSALCTVVGTLIGFIGGIYIPIGSLPDYMQRVIKWIPVTHSAALLREIFVSAPLDEAFKGAPPSAESAVARQFGIQLSYGGKIMPAVWLVLITLFTGIVFYILSIIAAAHSGKKEP